MWVDDGIGHQQQFIGRIPYVAQDVTKMARRAEELRPQEARTLSLEETVKREGFDCERAREKLRYR